MICVTLTRAFLESADPLGFSHTKVLGVYTRGVQSYSQSAAVGAGFHPNQAGAPPDSTCLIR